MTLVVNIGEINWLIVCAGGGKTILVRFSGEGSARGNGHRSDGGPR